MKKLGILAVVVLTLGIVGFAFAQGMMGGWGGGMMGSGMMGGWGGQPNQDYRGGNPLTLQQATEAAERYLASTGDSDLALAEVMEFGYNFYAEVEEESTGIHAFEILIDRYTGAVYPEPGPNMMWNTKYGHMRGGMMGASMMGGWGRGFGWGTPPSGEMSVTPEVAKEYAQRYLDFSFPGTVVDEHADQFYGYYTIHVLKDGEIYGMLSVNGYTGQVWYHTWHGPFIGMQEVES